LPIRMQACQGMCCRVEIQYQDEWGTVCDDGIKQKTAEVVCRQLKCEGGEVVRSFGGGDGSIWMDRVNCAGTWSLFKSSVLLCSDVCSRMLTCAVQATSQPCPSVNSGAGESMTAHIRTTWACAAITTASPFLRPRTRAAEELISEGGGMD
jgi:hypothetical protein